MATKTRAEIRARVRFLGTYENSAKFTDALVNDEIQAGLSELYEVMADANEGHFDTTASAVTVAAQDWVALPADFWRLRGVDVLISGKYRELDQIGITDRNKYQGASSRPQAYRTAAGSTRGRIILYPTPNAVETLRFVYTPTCPVFTSDADTFEFYAGYDDYVVHATLLRLHQREERPLGETQQELARITARIMKSSQQRRAAEPELIPLGRSHDLDDFDLWWS
jgi:hypothetical protein